MKIYLPQPPPKGMWRIAWLACATLLTVALLRLVFLSTQFIGGQDAIRPGRLIVGVIIAGLFCGLLYLIGHRAEHKSQVKSAPPSAITLKEPAQRKPSRLRRYMPVLGLLFLAPWVGEYLLGNVPASSIVLLPFLVPLYGGGALLIRELARRNGRGWPTILLLAVAYGIIEAGLADQTLFNPQLLEDAVTKLNTVVPFIGIEAYSSLSFIIGHAVWSIGIPIAIIEMLTPSRRTTPWLGIKGLLATAVLYVLGCFIVFQDMLSATQFIASPGQRIGTLIAVLALVLIAFKTKKRRPISAKDYVVPTPWPLGIMAFVVSGLFFARPENWLGGVLGGLIILVVTTYAILRWSQHPSWTLRHVFALVAGTLPTYAWGGFVLIHLTVPNDNIAFIGNIVFALMTILLLVITGRVVTKTSAVSSKYI